VGELPQQPEADRPRQEIRARVKDRRAALCGFTDDHLQGLADGSIAGETPHDEMMAAEELKRRQSKRNEGYR
jgi:hypothetical protein